MIQNVAHLLRARRFLPLFVTQFLGAFNDNLFKNAMIFFATYQIFNSVESETQFSAIAQGLFILPFFLWWPDWRVGYAIAFTLYTLMGVTDYFDGYVARTQGTVSKLGVFLDPIADKIMVAAVLMMLISSRKANPLPEIEGLHIIPALVILLREIIVSGLREFLAELRVGVPVSALAKWKTTLQLVALGALILGGGLPAYPWVHSVGLASLWAAAALTLVTGYDYLRIGIRHMD